MAETPNIQPCTRFVPMVYAYTTPEISRHDGWVKIGYTEKQKVEDRIKEQSHTIDAYCKLEWKNNAIYSDGSGEYFRDSDFHRYLTVERGVERTPNTEWFHIDAKTSREYFTDFAERKATPEQGGFEYVLRPKQADAVRDTKAFFENGGTEYLWNAKPRFGKTLTVYDLIQKRGLKKVLIVTNRPSIANSWLEDFNNFIGWRGDYCFVSDTDSLRNKKGVLSREEYIKRPDLREKGMVAFESLQGLKGSVYFGGDYKKLAWMAKEYKNGFGQTEHGMHFDLLVVDEAQEGVDTMRTERAFKNIGRDYTLYLSGTPFKALASGQFNDNQIFNWSYADEQDAKENWQGDGLNPYEEMPRLNLFTYRLSDMIYDKVKRGADLEDEGNVDYAFDLNEFFLTNESGKFIHEDEIKKFLHALSTQERYPFSTPELRAELPHTLWLLNRVASVKALAKLLREDPVFSEYEIIIAAGDGKENEDDTTEKAFDKVKAAVKKYAKTITLSVGQLTVGVTIPQWSGVLMLCNMQSPSSYMQAAFRAQNPYKYTGPDGYRYIQENAYVFDFDPARTLTIYDSFANNLSLATVNGQGTSDDRRENIRRLLNFFPVLGEDSEGEMVPLDAAQVLSIPRKIKSAEVVRCGFMSNFLFRNISNVFGAPTIVQEIVNKLTPAQEEKLPRNRQNISGMEDVTVDGDGNAEVSDEIVIGKTQGLFGDKIYEDMRGDVQGEVDELQGKELSQIDKQLNNVAKSMKDTISRNVIEPVSASYGPGNVTKRMKAEVNREIDNEFEKIKGDFKQQAGIAAAEFESKRAAAETEEELKAVEDAYQLNINEAMAALRQTVDETVKTAIDNKPEELIRQIEQNNAEKERKGIEDTVRDHLRGFSRTIPSFIMAYGDRSLTLSNIDDYTEDDVFEEVTGITEADFRFLRDGGDYTDPDTGETEHFTGHLFDDVVFDDSVQEFLNKKEELANYFDESHTEDIFDYIPPQRTNQIYTPRRIVKQMVDELEENNPGCFDDPAATFADLYMKSGLYITEIVKRLFNSEKMKEIIPDDKERISHIMSEQVYGMAPTRIIYLIATNYILGFDENMKLQTRNFVEADAAAAAKEGRLEELVRECFG